MVHGDVGVLEQLPGRIGMAGKERDPDAGLDPEREILDLEGLRKRISDPVGHVQCVRRIRGYVEDDAELVAAEPRQRVHGPQDARQSRADLAEQGVAALVPEGVVQILETVEVDDQHGDPAARAAAPADRLLDPLLEQAAIRQPREVVGDRLTARLVERAKVAEGERSAQQRRQKGEEGERVGELADIPVVVVGQHRDRGQDERAGHEQRRKPFGARDLLPPGLLPRSESEQGNARHVEQVRDHARGGRAVRHLPQVDRVGHRQDEEAAAEERPGPIEPPAAQREHPDHERREQQVADRVCELRHDGGKPSAGGPQHRLDDDRRADRADAEPGDDPVQPDAGGNRAPLTAGEQHQAEIAGRIEGEPQEVADRGDRRARDVLQPQRPQEVARSVEGEPCPDHHPGEAALPDPDGAHHNDCRNEHVDDRGRPVPDRCVEMTPPDPEQRVRRCSRDHHHDGRDGDEERPALAGRESIGQGEHAHPHTASTETPDHTSRSPGPTARRRTRSSNHPVRGAKTVP